MSPSKMGSYGYNLGSIEIRCASQYVSAGRVGKTQSRL